MDEEGGADTAETDGPIDLYRVRGHQGGAARGHIYLALRPERPRGDETAVDTEGVTRRIDVAVAPGEGEGGVQATAPIPATAEAGAQVEGQETVLADEEERLFERSSSYWGTFQGSRGTSTTVRRFGTQRLSISLSLGAHTRCLDG